MCAEYHITDESSDVISDESAEAITDVDVKFLAGTIASTAAFTSATGYRSRILAGSLASVSAFTAPLKRLKRLVVYLTTNSSVVGLSLIHI